MQQKINFNNKSIKKVFVNNSLLTSQSLPIEGFLAAISEEVKETNTKKVILS